MSSQFTPIDLQTWPRTQEYSFFSKVVPLGFALTVNLDVTTMRTTLKERNIKFFPAFVWLTTKILNQQIEFRVIEHEGVVGAWDALYPMYPILHEDDRTISMMWTEFDETFSRFYNRYLQNHQKYSDNHGFLSQPDQLPPANCFTITQLPWIEFTHFAFHLDVNRPHLPSSAAGKFTEHEQNTSMPFSVNVNHSAVDGWHVHVFLKALQRKRSI